MTPRCIFRLDANTVTEPKIIFQITSVRIDSIGRAAQIALDLQPGTCSLVRRNNRITAPLDLGHTHLAGEITSSHSS